MKQVGIFLDRDGTINEEVDFLSSPHDLRLIDGAADAIREANMLGVILVIITNQSGIARGLFTEEQLAGIHGELLRLLGDHDARIDAIYYCPHHPTSGIDRYRVDCDCRKPKTALYTRAMEAFDIDPKHSYVIGDRLIDIEAGRAIGARTILVLTGYGSIELPLAREQQIPIDYIATNLHDAMTYVKQTMGKA